VGCATRERANPFDPQNPATQGRPAGFVALAADQRVSLSWQPVAGENLVGYQLFRRRASETDFTPLAGTLPLAQSSFQDLGLINGEDVFYRCYFVFASGLGARFAEDVAAPGAVLAFYGLSVALALAAWRAGGLGPFFLPLLVLFAANLARQALRLRVNDGEGALVLFKSNTLAGLLLFAAVIAGHWRA
jgi:hypothetical protein